MIRPDWRDTLEQRQRTQVEFAELYARDFGHGVVGHNDLLLIARLAELLDVAAGVKSIPRPPEPADIVLTFGKYSGQRLGDLVAHDRGYVLWLAENADQ